MQRPRFNHAHEQMKENREKESEIKKRIEMFKY